MRMMPRSPHNREALVLLALMAAAAIWILAHVAFADGNEPNRVEEYVCAHSHYVKYEDGSGKLYCGRNVIVRVGVPW